MSKFILASSSPRRKELLTQIGLDFKVCPSKIVEEEIAAETPGQLVEKLSYIKAKEVASRREGIIIGADTVVSLDKEVLEKPATKEEAEQMLTALSGEQHQVITGITIIKDEESVTDFRRTEVKFNPLTSREIRQYIETGEPMDKAGSYGIQGKGALFVEEIKGCFYNVMGLSLVELRKMLSQLGVEVELM
jgi:septum formation protein